MEVKNYYIKSYIILKFDPPSKKKCYSKVFKCIKWRKKMKININYIEYIVIKTV